jgi:Tol biopolymer transport system component
MLFLYVVPAAQGAFPGENGKIAVARYFTVAHFPGDPEIYTLNPDGSGSVPLTDSPAPEYSNAPAWSPDGKKIAFTHVAFHFPAASCGTACADVYVMNADGSAMTRLTDDGNSHRPSWSPDGTKITFDRTDAPFGEAGESNIYLMNSDGTGVTPVTSDPASDYSPAWSPDGREIAFTRFVDLAGSDYRNDIHAVTPDGGSERLITENAESPNWSPDGTKIAFDADREIWVINADSTGRTKVTEIPPNPDPTYYYQVANANPAWSPDGSKIAYDSNACVIGLCGNPILATINPDGTGGAFVSNGGEPDWQPVGPQRSDYKNGAQFCKALREFLGDEGFRNRYGGGANAHGKCVSGDGR